MRINLFSFSLFWLQHHAISFTVEKAEYFFESTEEKNIFISGVSSKNSLKSDLNRPRNQWYSSLSIFQNRLKNKLPILVQPMGIPKNNYPVVFTFQYKRNSMNMSYFLRQPFIIIVFFFGGADINLWSVQLLLVSAVTQPGLPFSLQHGSRGKLTIVMLDGDCQHTKDFLR